MIKGIDGRRQIEEVVRRQVFQLISNRINELDQEAKQTDIRPKEGVLSRAKLGYKYGKPNEYEGGKKKKIINDPVETEFHQLANYINHYEKKLYLSRVILILYLFSINLKKWLRINKGKLKMTDAFDCYRKTTSEIDYLQYRKYREMYPNGNNAFTALINSK